MSPARCFKGDTGDAPHFAFAVAQGVVLDGAPRTIEAGTTGTLLLQDAVKHDGVVAMRVNGEPWDLPYNIEVFGENAYRITMAVAGFDRSEIEIEVEQDGLKITGRKLPNYI